MNGHGLRIGDRAAVHARGGPPLVHVGAPAGLALAVVVGLAAAAASTKVPTELVLGATTAFVWLCVVKVRPGVALGLWMLAAVNGLPFVNVDRYRTPGVFRAEDLILMLLIMAALYRAASGVRIGRGTRMFRFVVAVYAVLWALTLARTSLLEGIPLVKATSFGRDFLFFPFTAWAAQYLLAGARKARMEAMTVAAMGAVVYAAAQLLYQMSGLDLGFILHPYMEASSAGLARPYQWTATLVWLLVVPSLALGLRLGHPGRRAWLGVAALLGVAAAFGQTRASYVGLLTALCVWIVIVGRLGWFGRRLGRVYVLVGVAAAAIVMAVSFSPTLQHAAGVVTERAFTLGDVVSAADGRVPSNWAYRRGLAHEMLRVLSRDWPWGMGFLHPSAHPIPSLPMGSIRNNDLGMMQVLMTMGALGATCLIAMVAAILVPAVRWLWSKRTLVQGDLAASHDIELASGLAAALAGAAASSLTLGMFIDAPAATVTGALAAVLMVTVGSPDVRQVGVG